MVDLQSALASPPFQLALLAAYAGTNEEVTANVTFTFSNHTDTASAADVARSIVAANADLVAASDYAWNHATLCEALDLVSAAGTTLPPILLGGPNCTGRAGVAMLERYPIVSALVVGEGEPAFRDICESLVDSPAKTPFVRARNCRFRDRSRRLG